MSDTHAFEATLAWLADAAQKLPPAPAFLRNSTSLLLHRKPGEFRGAHRTFDHRGRSGNLMQT
jgi:hypothetical protein